MLKTATVEELLNWRLCYGKARIRELAGGVTSFTALDVLRREELSIEDRFWVVLRPELIEERLLHEFGCDVAEHVQPPDADPRSLAAIATKRAWLRGEASNEELAAASDAAWAAAWSAAGSVAGDAAWDAARDAAWAAARAAARAAAWDAAWDAASAASAAEREWQLASLVEMLEGEDTDVRLP